MPISSEDRRKCRAKRNSSCGGGSDKNGKHRVFADNGSESSDRSEYYSGEDANSGSAESGGVHVHDSANDDLEESTDTFINQRAPSNPSKSSGQPSESDHIAEDWAIVAPSSTLPTSPLGPTLSTALHDTSTALQNVTLASRTYFSSLSRSGLGQASRSLSSVIASTASSRAASIAQIAGMRTILGLAPRGRGVDRDRSRGRSRGRGQARRTGVARLLTTSSTRRPGSSRPTREQSPYLSSEPLTFGDERGAFVLETREMDATGEFVAPAQRVNVGHVHGVKKAERKESVEERKKEGYDSLAGAWWGAEGSDGEEDQEETRDDRKKEDQVERQRGRSRPCVGEDGMVRVLQFDE